MQARARIGGFTLIELSIVLVIIGLIVGGVLTGQSLISAAEVRAQITQIEKYNSAVNTFRSKFNALPGDMNVATAQQFGFTVGASCDGTQAHRDGNGLIDGGTAVSNNALSQTMNEAALFWQDISSSVAGNIIDGQFPNSGGTPIACGTAIALMITTVSEYFPAGKIGKGNYIYVYNNTGANWYGLSAVTSITPGGKLLSSSLIPVFQAYSIDAKIDDSIPNSGNVQAAYINNSVSLVQNAPNTTTSGGTSSSCYDTTTGTYSVTMNNGNGGNCALSFRFQ
jgi:prepilin-type N-terminal cleavage/methylation domain-containing protein